NQDVERRTVAIPRAQHELKVFELPLSLLRSGCGPCGHPGLPRGQGQDLKSHPKVEGEDSKDRWSLQDVCSGPKMLRTYVRSGQNERPGLGLGQKRLDRLPQLLFQRLVLEPAVFVEPRGRVPDRD